MSLFTLIALLPMNFARDVIHNKINASKIIPSSIEITHATYLVENEIEVIDLPVNKKIITLNELSLTENVPLKFQK